MGVMACGAHGDPYGSSRQTLAVDAFRVMFKNLGMAASAEGRNGLLERPSVSMRHRMGVAVARLAGRRGLVSTGPCLPVNALSPLGVLLGVAFSAGGQRDAPRVWEALDPHVAGCATQRRVRRTLKRLSLSSMTRSTGELAGRLAEDRTRGNRKGQKQHCTMKSKFHCPRSFS